MNPFIVSDSVHIRSDDNIAKIMRRLLLALIPIIIFSFYKNGLHPLIKGENTLFEAVYPLLMIINGVATSVFIEIVYAFLIKKVQPIDMITHIRKSYAIFPGLFLGLLLPVRIPIYLLMLSVVVGVVFGKLIFGGFGRNIFNPALIGYLFLVLVFPTYFSSINYVNNYELEAVSSATPLSILKGVDYVGTYNEIVGSFDSLFNMFLGFRTGSPAEVSIILILLAFVYLTFRGVIKPIIPITYVTTVFVITYILAIYNNMDIWYPIFHVLSGGLLFGAVFMATDPVTSPTTRNAQIFFGIMLGVITVYFRFLTPYSEGVMFSILICNIFVRAIDYFSALSRFDIRKAILLYVTPVLLAMALIIIIMPKIKISNDVVIDKNFKIISTTKENGLTNYIVTQKCFYSLKAKVLLDANGNVVDIFVLENKETFYQDIIDSDYLNQIISNQDDMDKLDTISGVTRTTNGLKQMIINIKNDFKQKN